MANENKPVSVNIMGAEYRLKRTEDEGYLKKVAEYVGGRMKEISEKYQLVSCDRIAVLSAMQIYDEMLKERESARVKEKEIKARMREMSQLIKSSLK